MSGKLSYLKGHAAEDSVARAYEKSGFDILARRWKSPHGEIDIVAGHDSKVYFIEVKSAQSFDVAAQRITSRQQGRIQNAALCYLSEHRGRIDVDCRFDAALVNGTGQVRVIPGAIAA